MKEFSKYRDLILKLIYYYICLFIIAFIYNAVFVQFKIVTGGSSGLAILVNELTGLKTSDFINIVAIILIVMSFIFLGKKRTMNHLLGAISYPLMVTITAPLALNIDLSNWNYFLVTTIAVFIQSVFTGLVYKIGYSTGGFDMLNDIISKKIHKSITVVGTVISGIIIFLGGIIFSPVQILYSLYIVYFGNKVTNFVMLGHSDNLILYIISNKNKEITDYLIKNANTGITDIKIKSQSLFNKKHMLMCVLPNNQYFLHKEKILKIDKNVFIIANKCYELNGGFINKILPF